MSAPANTRPMTLLQADGVLFDFNGTVSDDEGILRDMFIHLAAAEFGVAGRGVSPWHRLCSAREILADAVEHPPPLVDAEYRARVALESPIRPATRELVHALHSAGMKLGVVTTAGRLQVLPALERAGLLDLFGMVVTDEDVAQGTPHPEGFLRAAADLGLKDPSKVVAFEDSLPGLGAVAAAGMIAIGAAGTHPLDVLERHAGILLPAISTDCLELSLA
ncbi:hypothetical protein ART_1828 [Arthrobacter sp. PAMC 25486]|uniref:HAD family hydrolase n=1 Tax=Arthrobacter sp. PAMC 25486 TaxID=1494608 RepID=UPI0005360F01|nr:HAD family phosphatase [Arthrobacter sp. PAMC 25486]AIY01427.1 hypothetical protein ART_1828 [Arthrobacter sp. PAMC 25486]